MNGKDRVIVCYLIRNKHTSGGIHNLPLAQRYLVFHLARLDLRKRLYLSSGTCSYLLMVASVDGSELGIPWADWTHQSLSQQLWTLWITPTWRSSPWPFVSLLDWFMLGTQIFIYDPASLGCYSDGEKRKISETGRWNRGFPFIACCYISICPCHNLKMMLHQERMELILSFVCSS